MKIKANLVKDGDVYKVVQEHPYHILTKKGYKHYVTHWNGARIYGVYFKQDEKGLNYKVLVYREPREGINYEEPKGSNLDEYWDFQKYLLTDFLVKFENVEKVFVPTGEDVFDKNIKYPGNSLLLKIGKKYIYIGSEIFVFQPADEIMEYYSVVQNNDVPDPIAVGKDWVYSMINYSFCSRKEYPDDQDWLEFDSYDMGDKNDMWIKILHKDELFLSGIDKEIKNF